MSSVNLARDMTTKGQRARVGGVGRKLSAPLFSLGSSVVGARFSAAWLAQEPICKRGALAGSGAPL